MFYGYCLQREPSIRILYFNHGGIGISPLFKAHLAMGARHAAAQRTDMRFVNVSSKYDNIIECSDNEGCRS